MTPYHVSDTYPRIHIRVSVSDTPIHLCAFNFCRNLTYPRIRILPIPIRVSVSVLHILKQERRRLTWPASPRRCSISAPACACTSKATRVIGIAVGNGVQLAMDACTCASPPSPCSPPCTRRRQGRRGRPDGPAIRWPLPCPVKPTRAAAPRNTSRRPLPRQGRTRAVPQGSGDGLPRLLGRRARRCAPPRSRGIQATGIQLYGKQNRSIIAIIDKIYYYRC